MIDVPATLRSVGEAMYGEQWQTALGRDVGVADRTVRRWLAGTDNPRPGVWVDLLQAVERRRAALEAVEPTLRRIVGP